VKKNKIEYKILEGEYTYESGLINGKKIKKLPDVVVCSNDLIAYGVIESFKERKIKVPQDVSVTGYDDITFSKMFSPALTTVRQPIYEMGKISAEIIHRLLIKKDDYIPVKLFQNQVIVRESTKRR
jgi:LacI family transcriptional regulator